MTSLAYLLADWLQGGMLCNVCGHKDRRQSRDLGPPKGRLYYTRLQDMKRVGLVCMCTQHSKASSLSAQAYATTAKNTTQVS